MLFDEASSLTVQLWAGATLCIPDGERIGEAGYLGDWLARERISVCHITPAMADLVGIRADHPPVDADPRTTQVDVGVAAVAGDASGHGDSLSTWCCRWSMN